MNNKDKWISDKIAKLIKEGYNRTQAVAISYAMEKNKPKAQEGMYYQNNPWFGNNFNTNPNNTPIITIPDEQLDDQYNPNDYRYNDEENYYAPNRPKTNQSFPQNFGVGLEQSLFTFGQGLGEKDPWKTGVGGALSLLKLGRIGMSGYGTGKEDRRVYNDMLKNLYDNNTSPTMLQEGGKTNADIMTGQYLAGVPEGGNINLEDGEFVKHNQTNDIQKVVGEKHKDGGVDANLSDAKVLSDYTKVGAKTAKELKEKYSVSVKATDTFAKVMDKVNSKIGVTEATEELAEYIKKVGENDKIKDETTKRFNEQALTKEIEEETLKLEELKYAQNSVFEDLFSIQESRVKVGDGTQVLDKNGKPMAQEGMNITHKEAMQMSGNAPQMPIKKILYGVQTNEVKEGSLPEGIYTRVEYENGGFDYLTDEGYENLKRMNNFRIYSENQRQPQPPNNQIAYRQEGGDLEMLAKKYNIPLERAQELIKMQEGGGVNQQEQIMQMIIQAIQQGVNPQQIVQSLIQQGIPEQEAMQMVEAVMQQAPQEQEQPMMAQEGGGFSFSTKYTPTMKGFDVTGNSIVDTDTVSDVELMQPYTKKGYGAKMVDVMKTIEAHPWYFNTQEKKDAFIEASAKQGEQEPIRDFQKAYNEELKNRAKKAGVDDKEVQSILDKVGFTGKGVQQFDGKFGAFTSTRPMFDFTKSKNGEVNAIPTQATQEVVTPTLEEDQTVVTQGDNFGFQPYITPPSAIEPLLKPEVPLGRLEAIKMSPEYMLTEQDRQRQSATANLMSSSLPPQMQQALLASMLGQSQQASNNAIYQTETFNAQNQQQTDQFNITQADKENLLNAQFSQNYQDKMAQTLANREAAWRSYNNNWNDLGFMNQLQNTQRNLINAQNEKFKVDASGNVVFTPTKTATGIPDAELPANWETMSIQEKDKWKIDYTNARKKANYKKSQSI